MRRRVSAIGMAALLVLGGCASVPAPDEHFARVQEAVGERAALAVEWPLSDADAGQVERRVAALLAEPLDRSRAVEVALLNSPALRARYARLGMAGADLVEAGQLANPRLSIGVGFPDRPPSGTALDFGITANVLRAVMRPASRQLAALRLDSELLETADAVLKAAAEAEAAFLEAQAAAHQAAVMGEIAAAAEASAEFARRLHDAGNLSELALASEQALAEQSRLDHARALASAADSRQRLAERLGIWEAHTEWSIVERLPELPASEPDLAELESLAVRQRLDLAAAAVRVEAVSRAAGLQRRWRHVLTTEVGFNASRDEEGQWVYGPELSLDLPLFDQRQAEIARLEAALLGAEAELDALAIHVRLEVRRLRDRLFAARYEVEHYRDVVLPLRERITRLTMEQYNFMLLDTFDLLEARRQQSQAMRDYLSSIHTYWLLRSQLAAAVGGRLAESDDAAGEQADPAGEHTHDGAPDKGDHLHREH